MEERMIELTQGGAYLLNGTEIIPDSADAAAQIKNKTGQEVSGSEAAKNTIAYGILAAHNTSGNMEKLKIKFDKLTSHDITFVGIIQTARASGLTRFPIPYVLTNCHNSLCAVGGTINEDDHMFGLTCAKRYGGVYVPPHQAVIHQYAREMLAGGGRMILGSDSHTRYGALGTMAMGEGGPELVKQLLSQTYDINMPGVVGVYLTGEPVKGVGPQDVALAIIGLGGAFDLPAAVLSSGALCTGLGSGFALMCWMLVFERFALRCAWMVMVAGSVFAAVPTLTISFLQTVNPLSFSSLVLILLLLSLVFLVLAMQGGGAAAAGSAVPLAG